MSDPNTDNWQTDPIAALALIRQLSDPSDEIDDYDDLVREINAVASACLCRNRSQAGAINWQHTRNGDLSRFLADFGGGWRGVVEADDDCCHAYLQDPVGSHVVETYGESVEELLAMLEAEYKRRTTA